MKGLFGGLQCMLHFSWPAAVALNEPRTCLLWGSESVNKRRTLDQVVPKTELFMLTSKMLLNNVQAHAWREQCSFLSGAFLSYVLVERGCSRRRYRPTSP